MRKTNILWFLVAFIVLVIGYNMIFNDSKEGYRGGDGHGGNHGGNHGGHGGHGGHHGGGNHVYHSYGGHGGYYGGGGGYRYDRDYGRDYGYYPVYDRRGSGDLMTFYLLYPFLIFGVLAIFLSNRQ